MPLIKRAQAFLERYNREMEVVRRMSPEQIKKLIQERVLYDEQLTENDQRAGGGNPGSLPSP